MFLLLIARFKNKFEFTVVKEIEEIKEVKSLSNQNNEKHGDVNFVGTTDNQSHQISMSISSQNPILG